LITCRNPALAAERARTREALLAATEAALAPIITAVAEGRLAGADRRPQGRQGDRQTPTPASP
jgi:hypothetical protein